MDKSFTLMMSYCPMCGRRLDGSPESLHVLLNEGWMVASNHKPFQIHDHDWSEVVLGIDEDGEVRKIYYDFTGEVWPVEHGNGLQFYPVYWMYIPQLPEALNVPRS